VDWVFLSVCLLLLRRLFSASEVAFYGIGQWNINHNSAIGWTSPIPALGGSVIPRERLFQQFFARSGRVGVIGVNCAAEVSRQFLQVMCGPVPHIWHTGRVWVGFVMPYANSWTFVAPPILIFTLLWDVFAVSTPPAHGSGILALPPDLATVREARRNSGKCFMALPFGWTGVAQTLATPGKSVLFWPLD